MENLINGNAARNWATDAKKIFEASRGPLPAVQLVTALSFHKEGKEFVIKVADFKEEIRVAAEEFSGLPLSWEWMVNFEGAVFAVPSWDDDLISNWYEIPENLLPASREIGRLPQGLATRLPGEFGRSEVPVYRDEAREYRQRLLEVLQEDIFSLDADSFEPARILPPRSMLVDVLDEIATVTVAARTIFRADFPRGPVGGRRALAKVRGVSKVRASLASVPDGEDLPAAARPVPPAPKSPKMAPDPASRNSARKRWARLTVVETTAIERVFAAIGVAPVWQTAAGTWPGGLWTLSAHNALGGKAFCMRLFCRDEQEADRIAVAVPGIRREGKKGG